jgi:hypothetical protein
MSSREVIPISGLSLREVRRNSSLVIASLFLLASLTRGLVLERGIGQPIRRAFVEGAALGMTPRLLAADPVADRRRPSSHPIAA